MRQARGFIGGRSCLCRQTISWRRWALGNQQSGFILQVYGYWEMVAAFVIPGALAEALVCDTVRRCISSTPKFSRTLRAFAKG